MADPAPEAVDGSSETSRRDFYRCCVRWKASCGDSVGPSARLYISKLARPVSIGFVALVRTFRRLRSSSFPASCLILVSLVFEGKAILLRYGGRTSMDAKRRRNAFLSPYMKPNTKTLTWLTRTLNYEFFVSCTQETACRGSESNDSHC